VLRTFRRAGYTSIDAANGAGPIHIAAAGVAPDDEMSGYEAFGGDGVSRWGDYSAAAVAGDDGAIWIATDFIPGGFWLPAVPEQLGNVRGQRLTLGRTRVRRLNESRLRAAPSWTGGLESLVAEIRDHPEHILANRPRLGCGVRR
jgi:hypothetical protein